MISTPETPSILAGLTGKAKQVYDPVMLALDILIGRWGRVAAAAVATALMLAPGGAHAAKMDCGRLLERLWQTGESPAVAIDAAKGTVTVSIVGGGYCEEPIDDWAARTPPKSQPKPAPEAEPAPKAPTVTLTPEKTAPKRPIQPAPAPTPVPAPAATTQPAPVPAEAPPPRPETVTLPPPGRCVAIEALWDSRVVEIEGIDHWLQRAFTMDFDGIPGVDDISFVFKALDGSEKTVRYFDSGASQTVASGRGIEGIGINDDRLIHALCFGDVAFKKPAFFGQELGPKWIDVDKPDLAGQAQAKQEGRPYQTKEKNKKAQSGRIAVPKEEPVWPWIAGGIGVLAVGAAATWFFVYRRRRAKKKSGDDEDEEFEEPAEDEAGGARKPGLLARFGFGAKKNKSPDDENDEDAGNDSDDGGKKPAKPSLLSRFGLGGAKKKKKA